MPRQTNRRTVTVVVVAFALLLACASGLVALASSRQAAPPAHRVPLSIPRGSAVAFLGDSYVVGVGASSPAARWTTLLSTSQGWSELNFGEGGTGYVATGTPGNSSYAGRAEQIAAAHPDVIIVTGGRNDLSGQTLDPKARTTVRETFRALHAAAPDATLVAVSPIWDATPTPAGIGTLAALVRTQVEAVGGYYLDIAQPLRARPQYMSPDAVHPDDAGHAAIATATAAALRRASAL